MQAITNIFNKIKNKFFSNKKRTIIASVVIIVSTIVIGQFFAKQKQQPQYQTVSVEKGTLIISLSESGQVVVSNRVSVTTQASGIIQAVYVKNGDIVKKGEKIASVTLDAQGEQREAQTYSAYLSAQANLNNTNASLYSLQSTMLAKWKTYIDLAQNSTYQNANGSPNMTNRILTPFVIAQDDWLAAEAAYKNQQTVIFQAQTSLNNTLLSYQLNSANITAPTDGKIIDLTIVPGMQIGGQNSSTGNPLSQGVANIATNGTPVISVNLSETDVARVKVGDKATVTFDALPNKTFVGKVSGVNTTGNVSSGVTTYPAIITLDSSQNEILPNMSATANILTKVKDNVLLVPSAAVQTQNGQSTVRVMNNGVITPTQVEIGDSSETQTEIVSGLNEGEKVVVGFVATSTQTSSSGRSPFSSQGFGAFRGGR